MATTHDRPVSLSSRAELEDLVGENRRVLVEFYRRSRPSAWGLDPEGEGRPLSWRSTFTMDG